MEIKAKAYVSRAGEKLAHALTNFQLAVRGLVCADFGASTGGFTDCLLQNGAAKVYAVETGKNILDWKLRNDPRVIVLEKQNAMHMELPEQVDLITIDTGWTRLEKVIPNALKNLGPDGKIIALLKPHYEAEPKLLRDGKLPDEQLAETLNQVKNSLEKLSVVIVGEIESPITDEKAGNVEYLLYLKLTHD